jgi:hypothetical protein
MAVAGQLYFSYEYVIIDQTQHPSPDLVTLPFGLFRSRFFLKNSDRLFHIKISVALPTLAAGVDGLCTTA